MKSRDEVAALHAALELAPCHLSHLEGEENEELEEDSDLDWIWSEDEEGSESEEMLDTRDLSAAWRRLVAMPLVGGRDKAGEMRLEDGEQCCGCGRMDLEDKCAGAVEASVRGNVQASGDESDLTEWETAQSCCSEGEMVYIEGGQVPRDSWSLSKCNRKNKVVEGEVSTSKQTTFPIQIQLENDLFCLGEGGITNVGIPGMRLRQKNGTRIPPVNMNDSIPVHVHDPGNMGLGSRFAGRNSTFFNLNGTRNRHPETQKIQTTTKKPSLSGGWKRMKRELRSWILPQCLCPSTLTAKSQGKQSGYSLQIANTRTGVFNSTRSLKGYCRRQQYLVDRIEQSIA